MKPLLSARPSKSSQQGLTLIELMVALVIGLAVVLGAGKLFLVGLQGFKTVEMLGTKQEAVNFAATTLVRDVRRAEVDESGPLVHFSNTDRSLRIMFTNDGEIASCNGSNDLVSRVYRLSSHLVKDKGYSLEMAQQCSSDESAHNFEPLVTGFARDGFGPVDGGDLEGASTFHLYLELYSDGLGGGDRVEFYAVNRTHKMKLLNNL